jgi:cytoskeleton protein RodZ
MILRTLLNINPGYLYKMSNKASAQIDPPSSSLGPGDRLQAARISIGLTLEDVANRMHLSTSILNSLEENNFEDITAPIFVKGYLRSYARIVNLNEEEILKLYFGHCTDCDPPISSTSNTSAELNSDDTRVKWFTWLVILGLAALLITWWWNRYQQPAETLSLDSTESMEMMNSATDGIQNEVPAFGSGTPAADVAVLDDLNQKVVNELDKLNNDQTEVEPIAIEDPLVTEQPDEMSLQQTLKDNISSEVPIEDEPEQTETVVTSTANNSKGLVITVNADTWTDIRDASGKKLVYDLLRSGETVAVDGKAPLRAFFGNGYGVSMQYQGVEVDLSAVIKPDNTAKIRIGQ